MMSPEPTVTVPLITTHVVVVETTVKPAPMSPGVVMSRTYIPGTIHDGTVAAKFSVAEPVETAFVESDPATCTRA
jgi:hypothetical protein